LDRLQHFPIRLRRASGCGSIQTMTTQIPSADELKDRLLRLNYSEVQHLAEQTGVPLTTLWKIRDGTTVNPGVETVRKFWPQLRKVTKHV